LIRDIVWPNGVKPCIVHEKSADEKARTKIEAAQRILKIFQGIIFPLNKKTLLVPSWEVKW
jgi:hypothetical protein